jgi:hypothetical protein
MLTVRNSLYDSFRQILINLTSTSNIAGPSGRTVWEVGLDCLRAELVGSNPSLLTHKYLSLSSSVALSCVGRGLWEGQITRPKESYRASKRFQKPPVWGNQGAFKDCTATEEEEEEEEEYYFRRIPNPTKFLSKSLRSLVSPHAWKNSRTGKPTLMKICCRMIQKLSVHFNYNLYQKVLTNTLHISINTFSGLSQYDCGLHLHWLQLLAWLPW